MESFYFFIVIAGLSSLIVNEANIHFKGASKKVFHLFIITAGLGFLSHFAIIITLFFFVKWWIPISIFAVTSAISPFIIKYGRNGFVGLVFSVLVIVFNSLAWFYFLKFL